MITLKIVAYLVLLAVGYKVFIKAGKEKGFTKTLGQWIAWIIMAAGIFGAACSGFCGMGCKDGKGMGWGAKCGFHGMMGCPEMSKPAEDATKK